MLPQEMADLLDELGDPLGGKQLWVVISSALLALQATPEEQRNELFGRVKGADRPGGSYQPLIRWAKTGVMFADLKREVRGQK